MSRSAKPIKTIPNEKLQKLLFLSEADSGIFEEKAIKIIFGFRDRNKSTENIRFGNSSDGWLMNFLLLVVEYFHVSKSQRHPRWLHKGTNMYRVKRA